MRTLTLSQLILRNRHVPSDCCLSPIDIRYILLTKPRYCRIRAGGKHMDKYFIVSTVALVAALAFFLLWKRRDKGANS